MACRSKIASLATGLVGCLSIVGLVLGIVALVRIRRTGERGRGLTVGGIVAFAIWSAIATGFATGTLSVWAAPAERHTPHDAQVVRVFEAPADPYPGHEAFRQWGQTECAERAGGKLRNPLPPPPADHHLRVGELCTAPPAGR
jgi:hypothetical protein